MRLSESTEVPIQFNHVIEVIGIKIQAEFDRYGNRSLVGPIEIKFHLKNTAVKPDSFLSSVVESVKMFRFCSR